MVASSLIMRVLSVVGSIIVAGVGEGKSSLVNGEEIVDECLAIGMQNATRVFK